MSEGFLLAADELPLGIGEAVAGEVVVLVLGREEGEGLGGGVVE